jgi:hypothetical protein
MIANKTPHILIVVDHDAIDSAELLRLRLGLLHCKGEVATSSAADATEKLPAAESLLAKNAAYDGIFIVDTSPVYAGEISQTPSSELVTKLRGENPDLPIIVGGIHPHKEQMFREAGATEVFDSTAPTPYGFKNAVDLIKQSLKAHAADSHATKQEKRAGCGTLPSFS